MAEETATSHYVKLTKDHDAPMEEIRPGELNQPIHVPQLVVQRCHECGQVLPESYEPPTDEPWTTGICGCAEDIDSCRTGSLLPCVLFGRNVENLREDIPSSQACMCHAIFVEGGIALAAATVLCNGFDPRTSFLIGEGLLFSWWMCGIYTGLFRESLQKKYHLKDSPCDPCVVHCCMHSCALCQEHREMKGRLSDNAGTPMSPPTPQDMNMTSNRESAAAGNAVEK
ncbi:cell number regulator 6 [Cinnamomum micranthum f. kanehirae]|uniref:Cell number regulator 6 n=1 Tax=Cinnamomum micranthum f. kanehirae TaxID=337451 RepID=A0A3S3MV30_9MAGN|nr:cell number regulator 6 [Cinnamomum micranthum f. kanehirae]